MTLLAILLCLATQDIETTKLTDSVYMLKGSGGNLGVCVGEDGVFLIDDQFAPMTDKIRAAVKEIHPGPIRFVINTHWHGDHTGGNENFGKAGSVIVAHDNVRRRMSVEQFMKDFNRHVPPAPHAALPVITFSDEVTFHLNGETIRVTHRGPAHTDGDSIVHFSRSNVLHMGDLFFNGFYPFIDLSSKGSFDGLLAAVEKIAINFKGARIIPGHGPLADDKALNAYLTMLRTVREKVGPLVDAGKTEEQVKAAAPLKALDATWGQGFMKPEVFLGIVYRSLRGNRYQGPKFKADILVMESMPEQYAATAEVTVRTGGHRLTKDRAELKDGTLKLYLTLVAPGRDEMVTQVIMTLDTRHGTGTEQIDAVEVHVHYHRRGEEPSEPDYRVATRRSR